MDQSIIYAGPHHPADPDWTVANVFYTLGIIVLALILFRIALGLLLLFVGFIIGIFGVRGGRMAEMTVLPKFLDPMSSWMNKEDGTRLAATVVSATEARY